MIKSMNHLLNLYGSVHIVVFIEDIDDVQGLDPWVAYQYKTTAIGLLQGVIQKRYGIDDRNIYEANVKKVKTIKGQEYIKFDIIGL